MRKLIVLIMLIISLAVNFPGTTRAYARVIPEMPERYSVHMVRKGNTLWGISLKYMPGVNPVQGVKWICQVNRIPWNHVIHPGDNLIVPDYDGPLKKPVNNTQKAPASRPSTELTSRYDNWMTVEATAYCSCAKCCGKSDGITASGARARSGTIAVDPKLIPLGKRVYVTGFGWCRAEDTGRLIKGRKIDIWFASHREAVKFGRKTLRIKIDK